RHSKSLIAVGLAITVGFTAIFAVVLGESRRRDREEAQRAAANIVASISSDIDRNLELYDLSLQAVRDGMNLPNISDIDPELRQLVLFDRAATAKDMGSIFVLDRYGNVILDSRTLKPKPENRAEQDYFIVQERN